MENNIHKQIKDLKQENESLKKKLAEFQESEFHPDWSLLEASRDSLRESWNEQRKQAKLIEELYKVINQVRRQKEEQKAWGDKWNPSFDSQTKLFDALKEFETIKDQINYQKKDLFDGVLNRLHPIGAAFQELADAIKKLPTSECMTDILLAHVKCEKVVREEVELINNDLSDLGNAIEKGREKLKTVIDIDTLDPIQVVCDIVVKRIKDLTSQMEKRKND